MSSETCRLNAECGCQKRVTRGGVATKAHGGTGSTLLAVGVSSVYRNQGLDIL